MCTTDNTYEYVWGTEEPTKCPTNTAHTIDTGTITIVDEASSNMVKIKEENIATGGNYQATTVSFKGMTGPTGTSYTIDFSWPIPVNVLDIHMQTEEIHRFDEIKLTVAPNTIIGILTDDVCNGATGLDVSQTVIDNTMLGYYLEITDGAKLLDCGQVISIDTTNNRLVTETLPSETYLAFSPTYVRQTVYVIKDFMLSAPQKEIIGEGKIGGSYIPANVIVRAIYKTNSTSIDNPKYLTGMIEYLY